MCGETAFMSDPKTEEVERKKANTSTMKMANISNKWTMIAKRGCLVCFVVVEAAAAVVATATKRQ